MTQDQGIARGEGGDWTLAADELCRAVEKRVEATARKAAESLYEALLYDTQDHLRENVDYNLKAELDWAKSESRRCLQQLHAISEALGLGTNSFWMVGIDGVLAEIERLRTAATLTRGSTDD